MDEETLIQEDVLEDIAVEGAEPRSLVVYNDDYNTFEHVIQTLIRVCDHSKEQADQCAHIIHYKGKCAVKKGSYNELKPMKDAISDAGLGVTIE